MNLYLVTSLLVITAFSIGCDKKPDESLAQEPESIGPQFWLYDVTDYHETDTDVKHGLGGRWISVRYEAKPDTTIDRADKIREIVEAFTSDGWTKDANPPKRYVLSEIYETSGNDLYFRRGPKDNEPKEWFFSNMIHLSADGRILCSYCQVGW